MVDWKSWKQTLHLMVFACAFYESELDEQDFKRWLTCRRDIHSSIEILLPLAHSSLDELVDWQSLIRLPFCVA